MEIRHTADASITLTFDEGVWETGSAPDARAVPLGGGMGGAPMPVAGSANPDFAWLLRQFAADPTVATRELPELVRRAGASARALDATVAPTLTVELAPDESAALLVECDGVVAWQFPEDDQSAAPRAGGGVPARQVRFTVQAPGAASAASAQQRNVFADWILDRVRAVVLKFATSSVAGVLVAVLEKDKRTGPVVLLAGAQATEWEKPGDFSAVSLPDADPRILLFLHGTFSSTAGGFGDLVATRWGQALLQEAGEKYHAMLGFDHRTLSVEPSDNARKLYEALRTLRSQQPPTIDIVCHSRGALVARWLIENILPTASWQPKIGKVIFVGATNAGTELARPENWHALLDVLTNLALASRRALAFIGAPQAGFAAGELVQGIGDFVRYLVDAAVADKRAPGLAAMNPDGEFVAEINLVEAGAPTPADAQYYAVTSNFRPALVDAEQHEPKEFPRRLALMLANGFIGALMKKAGNDLVVNVGSMSAIDPAAGQYVKGVQDFGTNPLVYHTNYFLQPETVDAVAGWLGLAPVRAVKAVDAHLIDPSIVVVGADTLVKDALRKAESEDAGYVVFERPDPDHPGRLLYAPSVEELRQQHPDNPIGQALHVRESRRSPAVASAPFLRSLRGRTPLAPFDSLPEYSRRAVVLDGERPVGVIPVADHALDVLQRATASALRSTRGGAVEAQQGQEGSNTTRSALESAAAPALPARSEPVACHARAEMPPTVIVGSTATVSVTLSAEEIAAAPGTLGASAPVKIEKRPVTIEVITKVGFRLQSSAVEDSRITFDEPPAPGSPVVVDVEVVATDEGPGEIWALVRQGPVRAATLVLRPQVVAAAATARSPLVCQASIENGEDLPEVATLEITQQRNGNETRFQYRVFVPGEAFDRFESLPITGDLAGWVKALYQDIEAAWLGSPGNVDIFHDQLKARGAALFRELIPPMLADLLWRLRREDKLRSVLVNSDEPFVPWEVAYLDDPAASGHAQACFLGELGLCRWLFGAVPPTRIRVRPGRMRYVVPHYPDPRYRLAAAEDVEEPMLVGMGAEKIEPHYRAVMAALVSGEFDLLHFAGHGTADAGNIATAAVLLEGSNQTVGGTLAYVTEPLAASVVMQQAKLCGPDRNRPVVVLNACQVSRLGLSLTSLGGFAPAFLGARVGESRNVGQAGVFVSSLWSVGDQPASAFAQAFYNALQSEGGCTVARAVTVARAAARAASDATWLAYAVYAHPNCLVEFTP
jgi:hypothetical protein